MKILLFIFANSLLVLVVVMFVFAPAIGDIGRMRRQITMQESQYAARTTHYTVYEDNLRALETLQAGRRLLTYEEKAVAFQNIYDTTARNSVRSLYFASNYTMLADETLGQVTKLNIRTQNEVANILQFFYGLDDCHVNISSASIVWEAYPLAKISVEMSLFSAGQ